MGKKTRDDKKIDPEQIFLQSIRMQYAHRVLYQFVPKGSAERQTLAAPATILSTFCSELGLKCIIYLEKGYSPRGHDLKTLYDAVSAKSKIRIVELWDAHAKVSEKHWAEVERITGHPVTRDLPSTLAAEGNAFDLLRYSHEARVGRFQFHLYELPDILIKVIFEMRPDWAAHAQNCWNEIFGPAKRS
jgi:hypothetical protein